MRDAREVDLPEPVGPVTRIRPARLRTHCLRVLTVSGKIPSPSMGGMESLRIRQVMPSPDALRWV